jgi:hypothetical protein
MNLPVDSLWMMESGKGKQVSAERLMIPGSPNMSPHRHTSAAMVRVDMIAKQVYTAESFKVWQKLITAAVKLFMVMQNESTVKTPAAAS